MGVVSFNKSGYFGIMIQLMLIGFEGVTVIGAQLDSVLDALGC